MSRQAKHFYEFGSFRLDVAQRLLLRKGAVVPLTLKAFDLLITLVESDGQVLTKDELMHRVWPDSFVEEANLSHHIHKLREALGEREQGDKYIETLARRGYRFVAKVNAVLEDGVELLVTEHTRAHVVIEEETSEAPIAVAHLQAEPAVLASQASWFKRRKTVLLLSTLGLVLVGGAAAVGERAWFKGSRSTDRHALALAGEMKIIRVTNSGKVGTASISPDGMFIAYDENYTSGKGTLYVRQTGTNTEIQLLEPGQRFFGGTAFSPDGAFIYYVSYERNDPSGSLYRIPVLGGPTTRLIGNFDSQFTLSPDGRKVTFYRSDAEGKYKSIMIASLDTGEERTLLSRATNETILGGIPAWSPDGSLIAFAATETRETAEIERVLFLFAVDVEGGGIKQLSTERYLDIGKMNWTPDGKGLVFVALRPRVPNQFYYLSYPGSEVRRITNDLLTYGNYGLGITADQSVLVVDIWERAAQLWIIDADGGTESAKQLTLGNDDGARGISSLADGRIAYVARTGDQYDIWTVKQDGTEAKPLTANSFSQGRMAATPDGRYLVFTSDRGGGSHLFRMETDGSDLQQLTFGVAGDSAPDCSPDSKWVAYESTSGGKTTLWKVPLGGGTPLRLTDYESVAPSFSPDGQMVSCVLPAPSRTRQAGISIISADGGAPLKTFEVLTFAWVYNNPRWTPDGQALVFLKTENHIVNLWRQPLNGGPAQPLTNFKSDQIFDYSYTRDGKSIILARGEVVVNVAMIKHFL
jgi:Tol biopolymer transport system component/DNA-binding winged helix-turn-helix (wHTH) protein